VTAASAPAVVLTCGELAPGALAALLRSYDLVLVEVPDGEPIPHSFWGEPEAGIRDGTVFVRGDTPVHSALHEAGHLICARAAGRRGIDTDSGGTLVEEDAVCYLQILLADHLAGAGRDRLMADMDAWGYSFRLGSARAWFEGDADDGRRWLVERCLLHAAGRLPVAPRQLA
jgi:hypothetical protein